MLSPMPFFCFHCAEKLEVSQRVARTEECPKCLRDLHCCRNCIFYDANAYNGCREPQAERVVEKDRRNFCDYFKFVDLKTAPVIKKEEDPKKKLDDLFK